MDPTKQHYPLAVAVPFLAILSILISITPLVLHVKNRNFPSAYLVCWFMMLNIFNATNAFIWPTDDVDSWWDGVGLCDIEVKLMIASYIAVPGALVCIFRSLAYVLDTRRAMLVPSKSQRWRGRLMDFLFCVFVPSIAMITHIVYQKSRYYIFAISGCVNNFDESWVSLVLSFIWPPVICLIAAYYCGLVLLRLHKYRSQFGDILSASSSNLSKSRFIRLFLVSFVMLLCILPVQAFVLYQNVMLSLPWHPYSWSSFHGPGWGTIIKVPTKGDVFFDRWVPIGSSFLGFIFFGFGRDAIKMYRSILYHLGFGHCFPNISPQHTSPPSASPAGSVGSRAKLIHRRFSSVARAYLGSNDPTSSNRSGYDDLEKGVPFSQRHNKRPAKTSFWSFLRNPLSPSRQEMISMPQLSANTNIISANAWAGTSQSRCSSDFTITSAPSPTSKEFIRVKQVISQQSEMQV
ncbi:hypothetical protein ASPWEDRAFT_147264 [Aspergillus wentii DTO 134E9]|uniref:A-pheromone receptor PreA n=1 Tax=Aspergillus wentii DTO 134E9 TaxID=1073089 RepID=A0A1L9S314_ASPWE|nr:uncharacterized protein ASPWEDRAFT_147264 [Aspergillus wentii DTO 134E9]OJJ41543.1 hypothetical protein ASPWEDRAFT_147264 [Aspergillus wentii DTO 134E9]